MASLNPNYFVNSRDRILKQWIPTEFPFNTTFNVSVTTVLDPSNFWIQLKERSYSDKFLSLESKLQETYTDDQYLFESADQLEEDNCGVVDHLGTKRRVIFLNFERHRGEEYAKLYHCDYGLVTFSEPKKVMRLLKKFSFLPQQAISSTLAYLQPIDGNLPWTSEAAENFAYMVKGKKLEARMVGLNRGSLKLHLVINDISNIKEEINVNDALIIHEYAKEGLTIDWYDPIFKTFS